MFCSVLRADRAFIAAYLVALCLPLASSPAQAELPLTQQLIHQAADACRKHEKRTRGSADWPLTELANAQAYAGDYAGALQTARSISGLWKSAALSSCWKIQFERTGAIAELPTDVFGDSDLEKHASTAVHLEIAKVLAKAGRLEEAAKFLPKDDEKRATVHALTDFYLFLAEDQAQREDKQGASASLKRARSFADRFLHNGAKRIEWLEAMGKLLLQLGDRDQALAARDAALQLARGSQVKKEESQSWALAWARVGKLQGLLGENKLAREAFREALRLVDASDQDAKAEDFGDKDLRASAYIRIVGQIGAWQFAAGLKAEAEESYGKALARVGQIQDDRKRDYHLLNLLELQRDEGHVEGALKTLERMRGAYWKALGSCRCAEKLAAGGQGPAAQQLLEKAETLANAEPEPNNSTDMLVKIAEVKAKTSDLPAAKRCLEKALKASRTTKDNDHHQWIARCQIRVGLLEDAYETIMAIRELEWRLLPLTELAHQAAKREARAQKKGVEK